MKAMTDELVKRWDEYVESMGSVMGKVEHMAQQMRDRIEDLTAERDRLRALLSEADRRIVWEANGFGSDFAERVEAALKGETP